MSEFEQKVVDAMKTKPLRTIGGIVQSTGLTREQVEEALKALEAKGIVQKAFSLT